MRKKVVALLLSFCMVMSIFLCACGNSNQGGTIQDTNKTPSRQKDYPKYEDLEIYFVNGVSYGEPTALMGFTNNSDYTIVSIILNYTIRDDFSDDELDVFDPFVRDGALERERIPTLTPSVYNYMVCDPGETVEGVTCNLFGNYDATNTNQCELMKIKNAEISFLGKDGLIYTVSYSSENDGYSLQSRTDCAKAWTELDFASSVPAPDTRFITVNHDMTDYYQFTAYDITYDQYRTYCDECQNAGFTNEIEDNDISFWCTSNDGLTLNIRYYAYMNALIVYAENDKKTPDEKTVATGTKPEAEQDGPPVSSGNDNRKQKNGFNSATNQKFAMSRYTIELPEYWINEQDPNQFFCHAVENNVAVAELSIFAHAESDDSYPVNFEGLMKDNENMIIMLEAALSGEATDYEVTDYEVIDTGSIKGISYKGPYSDDESEFLGYAEFFVFGSEEDRLWWYVCLIQDDEAEYLYTDDFMKTIFSIEKQVAET